MSIDNREMVDHLSSCICLLIEEDILTSEASAIVEELKASIHRRWRQSDKRSWRYEMSNYIQFTPIICPDSKKELIASIRARVEVSPDESSPFSELDICLEIDEAQAGGGRIQLSRWHFDLANSGSSPQAGPINHVQYGGNSLRYTGKYSAIKTPRWHHHPLDLLLMLEVVTANFFEEKWLLRIKDNPSWCNAINSAQKLCIKPVIDQMQNIMNTSTKTILGEVWNRTEIQTT